MIRKLLSEHRFSGIFIISFWIALVIFAVISFMEPVWLKEISFPGKLSEAMDLKHLGDQKLKLKQIDAAAEYYKRALAIVPDLSSALGNMGIIYAQRGVRSKALEFFNRTLQSGTNNMYTIYHHLAEMYEQTGDLEKAEDYYLKCAKSAPLPGYAYGKAGKMMEKQQKYQDAIEAYKLSLEYESSLVQQFRGMLKMAEINYAASESDLENIKAILKGVTSLDDLRGYDLRLFNHQISSDKERAKTYTFLGNMYVLTGDLENAKENYEAALVIWPSFYDAKENLRQIQPYLNK